jgi:hypothetical protein
MSDTSPGARPCTSTWVGVTASASATLGSVTETRRNRSFVVINSDFPTITRKGADACASGWFGPGSVTCTGAGC